MTKKTNGWWIGIVLLVALLCLTVGGERYCFFYPSIDTHYAPGFSEKGFALVKVGMTQEEVSRLLGPPMGIQNRRSGAINWDYTRDGKCQWADWAWLGRSVVFKDDRVVEKIARVWYD